MFHDAYHRSGAQADPELAAWMQHLLRSFLRPFGDRLAHLLDIRLVLTALELVQAILTHRHTKLGLLLSELGGYLLGPEQASAGTKRISNLIHASGWQADDLRAIMWAQADARVRGSCTPLGRRPSSSGTGVFGKSPKVRLARTGVWSARPKRAAWPVGARG